MATPRATQTTAIFVNGLADSWAFAVPTSFRAALDIQLNERTVNGHRATIWTQGHAYAFQPGDILHFPKEAHSATWAQMLAKLETTVQVVRAYPASRRSGHTNQAPDGYVCFQAYHPNESRTQLVAAGVHSCSQPEFAALLQYGILEANGQQVHAANL